MHGDVWNLDLRIYQHIFSCKPWPQIIYAHVEGDPTFL